MGQRDRRTGEIPAVGGPERRQGDRRESPRIPIKLWVRDPAVGGSFEEREGDIAVGGIYFLHNHPPLGTVIEVRFHLPNIDKEIRCKGELLRVDAEDRGQHGAHLKFVGLDVETELAIARFLDDYMEESGAFKRPPSS